MSFFISLEGPEGSGKSTQARFLADYLRFRGLGVLLTREPGGTEIGDEIRAVVHKVRNEPVQPETELLLYSAARAQLVRQVIRPALGRGQIVILDRYYDSTMAYQGYARGLDLKTLGVITEFATDGLKPDLTFFIDVTVDEGLRRRQAGHATNGEELNRMDRQAREFYERVRAGYDELMKAEPARWIYVDGMRNVDAVQNDLREHMNAVLHLAEQ